MPYLWIPVTAGASGLQVVRNAAQRGIMGEAGPWGATLVRFLFGLPFSLLFTAAAALTARGLHPQLSGAYLGFALSGAVTQVLATAALLVAMRRAGFAVGTVMQQSSLPLSAVLGLVIFHDRLSGTAWLGVAAATAGVAWLSAPRAASAQASAGAPQPLSGPAFGLLSGLCFGFSLNAYRHAARALEPAHPLFSAVGTVSLTQAAQSLALIAYLAWRHPWALRAVGAGWRRSLLAGFCGAAASAGWLLALALAPAAQVRAVGMVEAPIAAIAGRRLFKERLSLSQWIAGATAALGVALTALG
jgi:drug/metabolite transporter (DMT)-like permease